MPKLVELNKCFSKIDVGCFIVFTDEAFIEWSSKLENYKNKLEWYFDEYTLVTWDSGKEFYDSCNIALITDEEALTLGKLFPHYRGDSGIIANYGTHCFIFESILGTQD